MTTPVRAARTALLVAAAGAATVTGVRAGGRALVGRAERRLCLTVEPPPYDASERARALHRGLLVADLHADSAAVGPRPAAAVRRAARSTCRASSRATSRSRSSPRARRSPRHLNIERNDDRSDDIIAARARAAAGRGRPGGACSPRALAPGGAADAMARPLRRVVHADPLARRPRHVPRAADRRAGDHGRPARDRGRARARRRSGQRRGRRRRRLPDDVAEPLLRQRVRRLRPRRREGRPDRRRAASWSRRMEARGMLRRPRPRLGARRSTTPWRSPRGRSSPRTPASAASADNARNLSDEQLRGIAATGGLVGIGFWPTACGGDDAAVDRPLDPLRHRGRGRRARRRSARTSTARSRCPSTRAGWCGSPTRCWTRASTTTRSRRSWARTRSASSQTRCRRPEPDRRSRSGQTSSAISAAARAAPSEATGRYAIGRSISRAMASAIASGSEVA